MIVLKLASEKESFSDMDVQEALNLSTGRTIILLSNMTKKGELQRISKGKYRLNPES
jgi:predicted transcriptional regulator of viral defense system